MDRAFVWIYAYNHEEAIACCERALAADPDCAMASVGHRLRHRAATTTKPWEHVRPRGFAALGAIATAPHDATQDAMRHVRSEQLSPFEKALIVEALAHRYPARDASAEDFAPRGTTSYADAMRKRRRREFSRTMLDVATPVR